MMAGNGKNRHTKTSDEIWLAERLFKGNLKLYAVTHMPGARSSIYTLYFAALYATSL